MNSGISGAKDFFGKALKSIGTGKILLAPVAYGTIMNRSNSSEEPGKTSSGGILGSVINSVLDA